MITDAVPLCVDMDGSLTRVDTLHESLLDLCRRSPRTLFRLPFWIARGKAFFKQRVAAASDIDVSLLPLHADLLAWLKEQRAAGRRLVLATAADQQVAGRVAAHIGIFDEVIASDGSTNRAGESKRDVLVKRFGEKGFDYVGNGAADLQVWRSARQAIVVGSGKLAASAGKLATVGPVFPTPRASLRAWLRAIRIHQWVKNVLVFVPALLAHRISEPAILLDTVLAFFAFNLCASSVYLINDLLDLTSDRKHPRKRERPFAAGKIAVSDGLLLAALLMAGASVLAVVVGPWFCAALARVLRRDLGVFAAPQARRTRRRNHARGTLYASHRRFVPLPRLSCLPSGYWHSRCSSSCASAS